MKSMLSKRKKSMIVITAVIAFLITAIGIIYHYTKRSYVDPIVTEVTIESDKVSAPIKYLYFADLHENRFGEDNQQLYEQIRSLDPDFILIGGDLISWTTADARPYAEDVIRNLSEIADVYFCLGYHEIEYLVARKEIEYTNIDRENSSFKLPDEDNGGLIATIKKAGAVVLQREWTDIEVGGTKIRIGAAFEDMYSLDENNPSATMQTGMYSFLTDFQGTDALTIYMVHRPSSFLLRNGTSLWDIDIVMSGHEHGGQVVLPSLGGLFSRERGFFPDYTHGTFAFGSTTMVVTSGLGSDDEFLPRFNNPPEMVLITVQ